MKLSFMTLGCPNWDLDTICARGREYGFDGVDLRGYLDSVDITRRPEFTSGADITRRKLQDAGLEVSAISSSINICVPEAREGSLEEARRTIGVAQSFDCQNVRIFGGGDLSQYSRQELAQIGRECVAQILDLDGARDLHWLFETHDLWIKSGDCRLLLESLDDPAFGALWDLGHTSRVGEETPEETYASIGKRIGYTHIKDAVYDPEHAQAMQDGWHYTLPGEGQLPLAEAIRLLKERGYTGWLQFEHEKRWHPELAEPEVAFPAFVRWIHALPFWEV
jgi:sugar phosphate isomerase/epimerase